METHELIYHCAAVFAGILMFFSGAKSPNPVLEFLAKAVLKLGGLYLIAYATVQLFKHFSII
jgi:hypothetical protein